MSKRNSISEGLSAHTNTEHFGWYALQVSSLKEKLVASVLAEKGYECFLPLYSKRSVWSDRIKVVSVPLFGGYVFSQFDARVRLPILVTPNVQGIVGNGKAPVAIPEQEIEAIRVALRNGFPVEPCDRLHEGDPVRVTKGPLAGVEGSFVRHRGSDRLVISISLINRSVAVEIDRLYIEPVRQRALYADTAG